MGFFGTIALITMIVVSGIVTILTESTIFSMFCGGVAVIIVFAIIWLIGDIIEKYKKDKKSILKPIFILLAVIILIVGVVSLLRSCAPEKSLKCVNCGKNAMYTETGYCRSCYRKVENSVKDAYNKYRN